ncbi:hypothetical protein HMI54_004987, partial [Coelomomyces lativittatus]
PQLKEKLLTHFDAIVLSPGPGHPENPKDFGVCTDVIGQCQLPILGICLGHQGIGLYFGGNVCKAPVPMHGRITPVEHNNLGVFRNIPSPIMCTRYHSLVVHEEDFPSCLIITAWANDADTGRKLIMGLQHKTKPLFGVQFHPESICSEHGATIAINFCQLAPLNHISTNKEFLKFSTEVSVLPHFHSLPILDIPVSGQWKGYVQQIDWVEPSQLAAVWNSVEGDTLVWLDSAILQGSARWSYLCGLTPTSYILQYYLSTNTLTLRYGDGSSKVETLEKPFFEYLDQVMKDRHIDPNELILKDVQNKDDLPQFLGGLVGYIGYEMKYASLTLTPSPGLLSKLSHPDVSMVFADRVVCFDHKHKAVFLSTIHPPSQGNPSCSSSVSTFAHDWYLHVRSLISKISIVSLPQKYSFAKNSNNVSNGLELFTPDLSKSEYIKAYQSISASIKQGDTYEVCLTTPFRAKLNKNVNEFELYNILRTSNPAPYSSYLRFGKDLWVACSSPERFFQLDSQRTISMKPIKGTSRRHPDPVIDAALAQELQRSEKDRAENLMIVDLIRNDLNLVSCKNTVRVPSLMHIESFKHVHQLVSTVQGQLHPQLSPIELFKHVFPPGSMTGAPKLRTVQILDAVEPTPRGVYSGAIGFFSCCGSSYFNVVIRTIVGHQNEVYIGSGGAIVSLSDPENEWDEILLKLQSVTPAIAKAI